MTATDRVFGALREQIVTGQLAAGSQHSIYRLAEQLGVSRTPVRDAVLRLADTGLLTIERNRGVRIRGVTVADVQAVFEVRALIEVPAASFAAARATPEQIGTLTTTMEQMRSSAEAGDEPQFTEHDRALHAAIGAVWGNARAVDEVARLRDSIQARGVTTIGRSRTLAEVAEEHRPIVAAITSGDPEQAAVTMLTHLEHTAALLMEQVATADDPVDAQAVGEWATRLRELLRTQ